MSAQELRDKAAACRQESLDSFERCDTDGFLSQWASDLRSQLYTRMAEIEEAGGKAEFWGLFDPAGNRVCAKLIQSKYGMCWAFLDKPHGQFTGRFVPFCEGASDLFVLESNPYQRRVGERWGEDTEATEKAAAKARKRVERWQSRTGLRQIREMAPADCRIAGRGTGLSGQAWVETFRTDGL